MNLAWIALVVSLFVQAQPPSLAPLKVDGDFIEPVSKLQFPVRVLGWERRSVAAYPEPGGLAITYELTGDGKSLVTATASVYRNAPGMPGKLTDHFASTLRAMRKEHPDAELLTEQDVTFRNEDGSIDGHLATLAFREGAGPYREPAVTVLTMAKKRNFWIEWQASAPASAGNVSARIIELINAFVP